MHWIKAEINEFILRNWRLVKIATTKAQRKLFFNLRSLKKNLGTMGPEEVDAIAEKLNVKTEEVMEMETRFSGRDISIEPLSQDNDETYSYSPIAYLTDGTEPSQVLEAQENDSLNSKKLKQALANLDARSCRIIEARWLCGKKAVTLHKLAEELGVSAERIRQIEIKALQKMRMMMGPAS
jgi:RNA polymerase sigma-32 factor